MSSFVFDGWLLIITRHLLTVNYGEMVVEVIPLPVYPELSSVYDRDAGVWDVDEVRCLLRGLPKPAIA